MMAQSSQDSIQVVTFNIVNSTGKKEDYAMPIENVREIRAVEKITKVPRSESFVKGIMNLRGLIIPVVDVKEKLGLGSDAKINASKQRILVAEVNGSLTGLLVDEVDQVVRLQTSEIEDAPPGAFDSYGYISGIAKLNEKLVILLDVSRLLNDKKEEQEQPILQKPTTTAKEKSETKQDETISTEGKKNDDIPPELAEVFKEDEQGVPPTQIVQEAKTIQDL